ncbi:MAG TPA: lysylphosphatidylglycerol synthase transmembrane domain-containing protein [Anaerolineales bacterium]|nr:lysylphosphatidylglycerol synthase transmembrane domain-containing protein [Anaerolineales bacterium]
MTRRGNRVPRLLRIFLWLALPLVVWLALRGLDVRQVGRVLGQLGPIQIAVLLVVNLLVVCALAGRWWAILAADGHVVPYGAATLYRLAGFGITYFTPGTQFGGEPLQAYLVHRRHAVPAAKAAAAIVLDRALELAVNFGFLALGMATVLHLGIYPRGTAWVLTVGALVLLAAPVAYLAGAWGGRAPGSWIVTRMAKWAGSAPWFVKLRSSTAAAEAEVSRMAHDRPAGLILGLIFSAMTWVTLLAEWWLVLRYLGIELDLERLIAVVTATRLALFVPVPGALGALEASLVLSLSALGHTPEQALAVAAVVRVRDIAFAATGVWLGGVLAGRTPSAATTESPAESTTPS